MVVLLEDESDAAMIPTGVSVGKQKKDA